MLLYTAFQCKLHQHLLCLVSPWEFKLRREKLKQKTPSKQGELSVGFAAAARVLQNQHILDLCLIGSSAAYSLGLSQPASPEPAWFWGANLVLFPPHELKAHSGSVMQPWGGVTHTPMGHHYQCHTSPAAPAFNYICRAPAVLGYISTEEMRGIEMAASKTFSVTC